MSNFLSDPMVATGIKAASGALDTVIPGAGAIVGLGAQLIGGLFGPSEEDMQAQQRRAEQESARKSLLEKQRMAFAGRRDEMMMNQQFGGTPS